MPATSNRRIPTLGLRTELAIERDRAVVEERDECIVLRTPGNPGYYLGNALLFDRGPAAGDEERWPRLFDEAFACDPDVRHAAFQWSGESGATIARFLERGYMFENRAVLTASGVDAFPVPDGLDVRALASESDWEAQFDLAMANREEVYDEERYARFRRGQTAYHRLLCERFGAWFGAFDGDRLAGSCGIFKTEAGIARYQDVNVHPAYRNRGIARCLVGTAGRHALEQFGASLLVIGANADDFPRRIYERCGFTLYQREGALWIPSR